MEEQYNSEVRHTSQHGHDRKKMDEALGQIGVPAKNIAGAICHKCKTKKLADWVRIEDCFGLQLFLKHEE